jgi:hypothetical protein
MVYASTWKNKNCFFLENDTICAAALPDLGEEQPTVNKLREWHNTVLSTV